MNNRPFQFKQFEVYQDKTAMKIGTDGVLLGAWVTIPNTTTQILDIGSGTGLIGLMMAQRSDAEVIDAIELNENAHTQSVENFENNQWADRLFCYHTSLQEFTTEIDEKYDLIISNPPFFSSTHKDTSKDRAMARHTKTLTYQELLKNTSILLENKGVFAVIIPYSEEEDFLRIAKGYNLHPQRITRVKGNATAKIKRSLLELTFYQTKTKISELIIEIERHQYTEEFRNLVKDFYL
ncbi:MAG: methyltransferase [Flavobacteriaceae bacterium]|nr:methyltransferase [Flavobacteriaceae bacterium]